jgi:hypothetical protein
MKEMSFFGKEESEMQDFLTLGTAPVAEPCVQVGQFDYYDTVKDECRRFIMPLRQKFGDEPPGARFAIKSFDHVFGAITK